MTYSTNSFTVDFVFESTLFTLPLPFLHVLFIFVTSFSCTKYCEGVLIIVRNVQLLTAVGNSFDTVLSTSPHHISS